MPQGSQRILAKLKLRSRNLLKLINHSDCLSNHAGLFRSCVSVGDLVEKGSLLGTVHDLTGRCIERARASRVGNVGILRTFASVQPGDRLAQLFWRVQRRQRSKSRGAVDFDGT